MLAAIKRSLSLKVSITLALVTLPMTLLAAYVIVAHEERGMEEMTIDEGKVAATLGAKMYGTALEAAVDSGELAIGDVFDDRYEEIRGYDFGNNPKYHTKFDGYTDRAVLGMQDRFLINREFVYAVGTDRNTYVPTHNTIYSKTITGNAAADAGSNRTKRKFDNEVVRKASSSTEPVLVQSYKRDTGENMWDVSAPIFVKGKHWGGFRVGVSVSEINARKQTLLASLGGIFVVLILFTAGAMFLMIRRSVVPLVKLSETAIEISTGESLEDPIKPTTTDEVGKMAKSLDRLRVSLKAAMERLGE